MKRILSLIFAVVFLTTAAACGNSQKTPEELLIGSWVSTGPVATTEAGVTVTFTETSSNYKKDGTSTGAALPGPIEMEISATSNWTIEGYNLTETLTDVDIKVLSKPDSLPDMSSAMGQQMLAEGASPVTITKIDKKNLTFSSDDTGIVIHMKRK